MVSVPRIAFESHRLANGLEVLLHPDNRVPLIHLTVHYRVGSSYEKPGKSGFAHLFEHLMFQGSENLQKNEHARLVEEAGGIWNATTNKDRTNYFETVPSHYIDLALWLEAERMNSLEVTREAFENQRQTVIEERKQSYENRPYGNAYLRLDQLAYQNWAYGHSIIGDVVDLERATVEDARLFHRTHYGPDNAVLCLSGDFDAVEALRRIEDFFGPIDHQTQSILPELSEPEQSAEKREVVEDPLAKLPVVYMAYHMPPMGSPDYYSLSILALVLSQGDSSRFYRDLVKERNWVGGISAGPNSYKGPQLFNIYFLVQEGVELEQVLGRIEAHLQEAASRGVLDEEMEKARNQFAYRYISSQAKASGIAEKLARYAVYYDDAEAANQDLERFSSVTAADLRGAAQRTFRNQNRTLIEVRPNP